MMSMSAANALQLLLMARAVWSVTSSSRRFDRLFLQHDEQCVGQLSAAAAMADNRGADMSCIDGVCACERGFHWLDGVCQRKQTTSKSL